LFSFFYLNQDYQPKNGTIVDVYGWKMHWRGETRGKTPELKGDAREQQELTMEEQGQSGHRQCVLKVRMPG